MCSILVKILFSVLLFISLFNKKFCCECQTVPNPVNFTRHNEVINFLSGHVFKDVIVTDLKNVKLTNCQIKLINVNVFSDMKKLTYLSLDSNQLTKIHQDVFKENTNLEELILSNNKIKTIEMNLFSNLKMLQNLSLNNNKITMISGLIFSGLPNLMHLDLSYNEIFTLDENSFEFPKALMTLNLGHNDIANLPDRLFTTLFLLENLNLNDNQIKNLPESVFVTLFNLRQLFLNNNKISKLDVGLFNNNNELTHLNVDSNEIVELPNGLLANQTKLKTFTIKNNRINKIGEKVFPMYSQISVLNICNNNLTYIDLNIIKMLRYLKDACFSGNPWNCDCNLNDFHDFLLLVEGRMSFQQPACASPDDKANKLFSDIRNEEIQSCSVEKNNNNQNKQDDDNANDRVKDKTQINILDIFGPPPSTETEIITTSTETPITPSQTPINTPDFNFNLNPTILPPSLTENVNNVAGMNAGKNVDCSADNFKNLIEWRAKLIGDLLITYSSIINQLPSNHENVKKGIPVLLPNQNGFTFMDPRIDQKNWKFISKYLENVLSATEQQQFTLNRNTLNQTVLHEISVLLESASLFVKTYLQDNGFSNPDLMESDIRELNSNDNTLKDSDKNKETEKNDTVNGKHFNYYYINASADGHGYVNINTGK